MVRCSVEVDINEDTLERVKSRLENLLDMNINSEFIVKQVVLACMEPMIIKKGTECDNLRGVLGNEFDLSVAKLDFQKMLNFYTKKYVAGVLEKVQESLALPEIKQISSKEVKSIVVDKKVVTKIDPNIVECDIDLNAIPKVSLKPPGAEPVYSRSSNPVTMKEIVLDNSKNQIKSRDFGESFDWDDLVDEDFENALSVDSGEKGKDRNFSSLKDSVEFSGVNSHALDGSRFSDDVVSGVPDLDFDDLDLD